MRKLRRRLGRFGLAVGFVLAYLAQVAPGGTARAAERTIRIGVVSSVLRDIPEAGVKVVLGKFTQLIDSQTGIPVEIKVAGDAMELSDALSKGKYDMAVFHGHEFAWAREKVPDLQPILIAVNRQRELRAHIVVRKGCEAAGLKDLQGKVLVQPWRCKEFARLFVQRRCLAEKKCPCDFFRSINQASCAEAALDMICDGEADACIIDGVGLATYADIKPQRFARLRVLQSSETFPASVLTCRKDAFSPEELKTFCDGMLAANHSKRGQDLMKWCQITSFEPMPDNYEQLLAEIIKAYPPPEAPKKK